MRISELIQELETQKQLHGDVECRTYELYDYGDYRRSLVSSVEYIDDNNRNWDDFDTNFVHISGYDKNEI